ncbi:MAG: hypothetical protein ACK5ZJ_09845, partial [Acidobacteriota bacterium]
MPNSNWALERVIEEAEQVAVDKQLATQQGNKAAGVPFQAGAEFEKAHQQQGNQCCPNLDLQGV